MIDERDYDDVSMDVPDTIMWALTYVLGSLTVFMALVFVTLYLAFR